MRYLVRKSVIDAVGRIWMPAAVCSMRYTLDAYHLNNIREEAEHRTGSRAIDREAVHQWLATHAGDFQQIIDFQASIEDGDQTIDIPWATEDGEAAYLDTISEGEL